MRRLVIATLSVLLAAGVAFQANAAEVAYHGTLRINIGQLPPAQTTGTGIATVTLDGEHLQGIRFKGGDIQNTAGEQVVPVTDPEVTFLIPSVRLTNGGLGTGTLGNFSAPSNDVTQAATGSTRLNTTGQSRVCVIFTDCSNHLPPTPNNITGVHTAGTGTTSIGAGLGGFVFFGGGGIKISLDFAPWTIKGATLVNQTPDSNFETVNSAGFVHDPSSGTTNTVTLVTSGSGGSGWLQIIAPTQVSTQGIPGGGSERLAIYSILAIHFVPEPGILLLLGSGVAGLVLLGRSRIRK